MEPAGLDREYRGFSDTRCVPNSRDGPFHGPHAIRLAIGARRVLRSSPMNTEERTDAFHFHIAQLLLLY